MSDTLPKNYIRTFENSVRHLAQQGTSRLINFCDVVNKQSEGHAWERMAASEASDKTARLQDTPNNNTDSSRRLTIVGTKNVGDSSEQEDIAQMLIDPNSNYAKSHGMAMRRAQDDLIISAALGDSRNGDGTALAMPAGQVIGDGTASFNYDMVTETTEKFLVNDVDPDEEKVFVISPIQMRKLLQITEARSADYANIQTLQAKGVVENWMGYTWIVSNRLKLDATVQPTTGMNCFAMTKRAMGYQNAKDITCEIAKDPSKSFAWRIYTMMVAGSVRVEDEHMVHVNVADAL